MDRIIFPTYIFANVGHNEKLFPIVGKSRGYLFVNHLYNDQLFNLQNYTSTIFYFI